VIDFRISGTVQTHTHNFYLKFCSDLQDKNWLSTFMPYLYTPAVLYVNSLISVYFYFSHAKWNSPELRKSNTISLWVERKWGIM